MFRDPHRKGCEPFSAMTVSRAEPAQMAGPPTEIHRTCAPSAKSRERPFWEQQVD